MRAIAVVTFVVMLYVVAPLAPPAVAQADEQPDAGGFVVSARPVALRGGISRVRVSCRAPRGCDGTLVLGVRGVTIGKRSFDMAARRRNARVAVRLTRAGLRRIGAARRIRVTAVASVRFGDGRRAKRTARFWLRLPRVS